MSQFTDPYWSTARDFGQKHIQPDDRVLAPKPFKHILPNWHGYNATHNTEADQFQWVFVHKGRLNAIDADFLRQTVNLLPPVFANEVFVIFTSRPNVPKLTDSTHLQPILDLVDPVRVNGIGSNSVPQPGLMGQLKQLTVSKTEKRLTALLSAVLDRLNTLERSTKKLERQVKSATVPNRSSLVMANLSLEELRSTCRSACQTAYLGENTILCRVLANYLLYGDTRDIGIVPHLCLNGFWEPWVTLSMMRILKPGWHCLDVGANHGYYSVLMSSMVGASGRVIALEPNHRLADMVRKTMEVNGFNDRATVRTNAVSSKSGEIVKLTVPPGHTGHASIKHTARPTDEVMEVETVTIDELTAEWPQVNLIKVDVEGAEEFVWQGMRETVRRNKDIVIVLEFGANRYPNSRAFLEEIVAEGFILRYIDYDTHPKEISIDECLSDRPHSFWDLYLSRS
ncbi:FkbM family methyltransferase [Egbenema bharatensis]|uniref:FkbM family methyltransferase n=1 Tax=Egbenema bharatensis TaxID=3463334 RepID=UPI003A8B703E